MVGKSSNHAAGGYRKRGVGMTSLKLQGQLPSTYKFHLIASKQCCSHVQFPIKSIKKYPILLAKLPEEDDPECNSWKMYAFHDTLNAVNRTLAMNLNEGNAYAQPDKSGRGSVEVSELIPSYGHCLPELPTNRLLSLLEKLKAVHLHLLAAEHWNASHLRLCHRNYVVSATNLTHYLALKCLHLQQLQEDLSSIGLLTLEFINSHVLASIGTSIQLLHHLLSNSLESKDSATYLDRNGYSPTERSENAVNFAISTMKKRVSVHNTALFGECLDKRTGQIMVTIGKEVVKDEILVKNLLKAGTNVIRINCAHDDPNVWREIIRIVKHNSHLLEKPCRILMDLAGPKLRTVLLRTHSNMVKLSPKKDSSGNVVFPAQVWLCFDGSNPPAGLSTNAIIWIQKSFFNKLKMGDYVSFVDVRGRKRVLKVLKKSILSTEYGCIAECLQTAYIKVDTELSVKKKKGEFVGRVIKVLANQHFVRLKVGDLLTIFRSSSSYLNELSSTTLGSTKITCSSDHIFESVEQGEPILFDDGKILGKVREVNANWATVVVTHARPKGSKLGSGKSINIPKSRVQLKGLTPKDLLDLDFVGSNADMVGISFIRNVDDIVIVQHELEKRNLTKLGIVLKIETKDSLQRLPSLLFQAMQTSNPLGVMIARGDLMVECGWDQLGEIQEEILSICSAAHIPVIWATQVLESLVKFGFPTRAEITDVFKAMGASCIMLNKGDNIVQAVTALNSLLSNRSSSER
ncbi:plastidial pyruvate kinase 4, chloroplastic-like isoform X1 [Dendrobium catenatum]|uniref:plastidial pyruvate kinase 4, chloroplastic-like isoform X1 n=1 Tax=Dendrobium catenatum TaxID=906689 RepID=UPI0009F40951|nr:plastidial pyruvate kinase 4, chloroplastic-like isoform X1 [Dendrobium catenatum]